MDGDHASHDPARPSTLEPTTGRQLNILDMPGSASSKSSSYTSSKHSSSYSSSHSSSRHTSSSYTTSTRSTYDRPPRSHSRDVPKGRPLTPSSIQSPRPHKPHETRRLTTADYRTHPTYAELADKFAAASLSFRADSDSDSDIDSDVPSLGRYSSDDSSSGYSSPASPTSPSLSSGSASPGASCKCDRFGLTRFGDRVRLECGGSRCGKAKGYVDGGGLSPSSSDSEGGYQQRVASASTKRHATVVRAPKRR